MPRTYIKVWDPENEEWVYIPEEDVPRIDMNVPRTGDNTHIALWGTLAVLSGAGLTALVVTDKTRKN